jgi:hypothetical protein
MNRVGTLTAGFIFSGRFLCVLATAFFVVAGCTNSIGERNSLSSTRVISVPTGNGMQSIPVYLGQVKTPLVTPSKITQTGLLFFAKNGRTDTNSLSQLVVSLAQVDYFIRPCTRELAPPFSTTVLRNSQRIFATEDSFLSCFEKRAQLPVSCQQANEIYSEYANALQVSYFRTIRPEIRYTLASIEKSCSLKIKRNKEFKYLPGVDCDLQAIFVYMMKVKTDLRRKNVKMHYRRAIFTAQTRRELPNVLSDQCPNSDRLYQYWINLVVRYGSIDEPARKTLNKFGKVLASER